MGRSARVSEPAAEPKQTDPRPARVGWWKRMNRRVLLFLLFAALLACFGADGERHAARRDVWAVSRQRVPPKDSFQFVVQ
jgi:hypothetical protein